jgi:hypothetical protein
VNQNLSNDYDCLEGSCDKLDHDLTSHNNGLTRKTASKLRLPEAGRRGSWDRLGAQLSTGDADARPRSSNEHFLSCLRAPIQIFFSQHICNEQTFSQPEPGSFQPSKSKDESEIRLTLRKLSLKSLDHHEPADDISRSNNICHCPHGD